MPYKDIEKRRAAGRRHMKKRRENDREGINAYQRKWNHENRESQLAHQKKYRDANKESLNLHRRNKAKSIRELVFEYYGKSCVCCGESGSVFLTIDHINGGGNQHRREIGGNSTAIYRWLVKNNF